MDRIAFQFGSLVVTWYGVLIATGFLVALWSASRRAPDAGISGELIADLGPWLIAGAIVGSRVWHVIEYWRQEYANYPLWEVVAIWRGGLVFYGGLVGASLATIFFARARKVPLWRLADVLAPSIALGHVFGRIGCLINGCCYGRPSRLPWAVYYRFEPPPAGVGVHPTQLYEAALNLFLYGALVWAFRRRRFEGQVFAVYLIGYSLLRLFVEFFRDDYPVKYLGGWATPAQFVSLGVLAAGVWLGRVLARSRPGPAEPRA